MTCDYYESDERMIKKELFNEIAEMEVKKWIKAEMIEKAQKALEEGNLEVAKKTLDKIKTTASSQIRKYYDEVQRYRRRLERITGGEKEEKKMFRAFLPAIKMIRAKVMYAKARGVVTDDFVAFFNKHLSYLESEDDVNKFRIFCRYFESILGFYKYYEELKENLMKEVNQALREKKKRQAYIRR